MPWQLLSMTLINSGRIDYLAASSVYGVPRSTLARRVKDKNKLTKGSSKMLGTKRREFTEDIEHELEEYVLTMEEMFFGITLFDLLRLA